MRVDETDCGGGEDQKGVAAATLLRPENLAAAATPDTSFPDAPLLEEQKRPLLAGDEEKNAQAILLSVSGMFCMT